MTATPLVYSRVAAALHWIIAALVITLVALGLAGEWIGGFVGMSGLEAIQLHKSLGMTVFVLTLVRLYWRIGHKPPPLPESMPQWQRRAAHAAHGSFYAFMLGLPVLGYMLSSGGPYPLKWFAVPLPKLPVSKTVGDLAHDAHEIGGITMAVLIVLHIGAALWHQFVDRDRLLARMRVG